MEDLPVVRAAPRIRHIDGARLASTLRDMVRGYDTSQVLCCFEQVGRFDGKGVGNAFGFGHSAGVIEGVVTATGLPYDKLAPAVWRKAMGIGGDPRATLTIARQLYPAADLRLIKHAGRAKALLLARHGWLRQLEAVPRKGARDSGNVPHSALR